MKKSNFRKIALRLFLIILLVGIGNESLQASVILPGEEVIYEVSFLGIKLGAITVITDEPIFYNGRMVNKARCYMDSYSGIPFVDLHSIFESWIDSSAAFAYKFVGKDKLKDGVWCYQQYIFDYSSGKVSNEKWIKKDKVLEKYFQSKRKWCDGLSLFFFARQFTRMNKSIRVPTLIDKDSSFTTINFRNKIDKVDISAVDYPVRTIYFDGKAEWTGVYGVTGYFQGWFSDDEARIPILAKMRVYVGDVDIELIKWKRKNWSPPRAE